MKNRSFKNARQALFLILLLGVSHSQAGWRDWWPFRSARTSVADEQRHRFNYFSDEEKARHAQAVKSILKVWVPPEHIQDVRELGVALTQSESVSANNKVIQYYFSPGYAEGICIEIERLLVTNPPPPMTVQRNLVRIAYVFWDELQAPSGSTNLATFPLRELLKSQYVEVRRDAAEALMHLDQYLPHLNENVDRKFYEDLYLKESDEIVKGSLREVLQSYGSAIPSERPKCRLW